MYARKVSMLRVHVSSIRGVIVWALLGASCLAISGGASAGGAHVAQGRESVRQGSCGRRRILRLPAWSDRGRSDGIELHPILGFACLSKCGPSQPPPSPAGGGKCATSYPTVCIRPPPPDLNCPDIPYRDFRVLWNVTDPDPHHFDGNHDGVGCET